jgi:hypothetical protein
MAIAAFAAAIAPRSSASSRSTSRSALVVVAYVLMGLLGGTEVYEAVDWRVIVLLGSLIPLGRRAGGASGGTQLIAETIVANTHGAPAWVVLAGADGRHHDAVGLPQQCRHHADRRAHRRRRRQSFDVNPDPFLIGVAVAASCAFLTPIGHKNNTIIMGPGGYAFGDYWRMGIFLEFWCWSSRSRAGPRNADQAGRRHGRGRREAKLGGAVIVVKRVAGAVNPRGRVGAGAFIVFTRPVGRCAVKLGSFLGPVAPSTAVI